MNKTYYYPAIFTKEDVGFSVSFPDLPGCYTEGDTIEEAYKMSTSAIGLYAQNEEGDFIFPEASAPNDITLEKDEFLVLVEFDLVEYLKIQTWDGKLPQVSGATPLVSIPMN